jgi:hypothetical protein
MELFFYLKQTVKVSIANRMQLLLHPVITKTNYLPYCFINFIDAVVSAD